MRCSRGSRRSADDVEDRRLDRAAHRAGGEMDAASAEDAVHAAAAVEAQAPAQAARGADAQAPGVAAQPRGEAAADAHVGAPGDVAEDEAGVADGPPRAAPQAAAAVGREAGVALQVVHLA